MRFIISGRPNNCSFTEVKALLRAADLVLRYMGFNPPHWESVAVKLRAESGGSAYQNGSIELCKGAGFSEMATLVTHELLHLYNNNFAVTEEWLVSSVTSRIKTDVIDLANLTMARAGSWAAIKAHCKLTYNQDDQDVYNEDQWTEDHAPSVKSKTKRRA